jgi:hypothetical protein
MKFQKMKIPKTENPNRQYADWDSINRLPPINPS